MSTIAEQLAGHIEELMLYWPALATALDRDQGGGGTAGSAAGGSPVLSAPVNMDVLRATSTLTTEVPATAAWCCQIVQEPPASRPVDGHLPHFPRWHQRMAATHAAREARSLAATVHGWRDLVKRAIGLLVHDRQLGEHCPAHDEPLVELVAPGDEGWLSLRQGDLGPTVAWVHVHAVVCRHCGARWAPARYLWLGRLLRAATARRVAAVAGAELAEAA